MKKYLKIALVVLVCVVLVGCGCNKKENGKDKKKEETAFNLYTDDTKLVYKNKDLYKIVFYYEGNNITGVEHYYEYKDENEAKLQYEKDKETYKNNTTIKTIKQVDKYVVYVMNESEYEGKTVESVKNDYSYLVPVYEK